MIVAGVEEAEDLLLLILFQIKTRKNMGKLPFSGQ